MVKIAVLASFNMDLVMRVERRPEAGETVQGDFAMHLGGKGFNQAVAARRLGAEVVVCGRVGDDEFGRQFLAALDDEGIDRRAVVVDPEAGTGVATIYVERDGENTIVQSPRANLRTTAAQVEEAMPLFEGAQMGMTQREISEEATDRFLYEMFDRGMSFFNAAPAGSVPKWILDRSCHLVVNQVEAQAILGTQCRSREECVAGAQKLGRRADAMTVLTMGNEGSIVATMGTTMFVPAVTIETVDTTGAGDAFCGALAVWLAEGAELVDAMRFANAAGALACTKHGAYPSMPYRDDVEALLREQGSSR